LLSIAFAAVGACSKSDKTTGTTDPGTGTITVGFTTITAQAATGTPATLGATLVRTGNYIGEVGLTMEGLPTGVTASFAPVTLIGATLSSIVTVTVGPGAVAGVSTLTLRGTGAGVASSTATVQLTVGVAGVNLNSTVTAATAVRGGTAATVPITIDRVNNYAGSVNLIADSLPVGVTATFTPPSLTGTVTASTLTLNALSSAAIGTTPITIRATGGGIADKRITVQLTVNPTP
ncbi:MAG: hypothetical protein ABJC26_07150, partial [Gemmatimonadaceae bacterium]